MLIHDMESYEKAIEFIASQEMLAYDTETTGLNPRRDKIMGFGISGLSNGIYVRVRRFDSNSNSCIRSGVTDVQLLAILNLLKTKKLLMFNASFDARFTKYDLGVDLVPALHADVLLLKHTCDEDFPLDLKGIGKKLYGIEATAEKEELKISIKSNGGAPSQYFKASEDILSRYCIQDCLLTFRIYNHYLQDLKRQGLEAFYFDAEVLPLYKNVTIPMEEAGVRLDIPSMLSAQESIETAIRDIERSIQSQIAPDLQLFTNWFLNKDYPVQTRTGKQPAWAKAGLSQEQAWFRDNKDVNPYMFNLQSKHHLKKLFFDTYKLEPLSKTPTGLPQVDEDFLESIKDTIPFVSNLIIFNKLCKIKSTYIDRLLAESEEGRFYASYQQHRTVSGRYSGDLQQLPRPVESRQEHDLVAHYTSLVRTFILPDTNSVLMAADYVSLEPTIFAHTSNDSALQAIFLSGKDFYSEIAIRTEKIPNVSSDKSAPNYLGKVSKAARQKAKAYSLGIPYGLTDYKLQFEIGVTQNEAAKLIADYMGAFPDLARWIAASHDEVCLSGRIKSQAGRIRHMPRAMALFKCYGTGLSDSLYLWKRYHENSRAYEQAKADRREFKNYLNNSVNYQVQSLAASIVNRAAIAISKKLISHKLKSQIVIQVHDELVLNVPNEELETVRPMVKDIMENIVKLAVPLKTEPQTGVNYKECK